MSEGVNLTVEQRDLQQLLGGMVRRSEDTGPAMRILTSIMRTSVVRNFEEEGRPQKWTPLAPSTVRKRGAAGPILRVQGFAGGLLGSIHERTEQRSAKLATNKPHAAIHQLGGTIRRTTKARTLAFTDAGRFMSRKQARRRKKAAVRVAFSRGGRSYTIRIPARPYLLIQDEDVVEMRRAVAQYITGGQEAAR